ncbi:MAG: hypothetical protein ACPGQL_06080 [Thermoplasmatota archaeon]
MLRWLLVAGLLMVPAGCLDDGSGAEESAVAALQERPWATSATGPVEIQTDCQRLPCQLSIKDGLTPMDVRVAHAAPDEPGSLTVVGQRGGMGPVGSPIGPVSPVALVREPLAAWSHDHGHTWTSSVVPMGVGRFGWLEGWGLHVDQVGRTHAVASFIDSAFSMAGEPVGAVQEPHSVHAWTDDEGANWQNVTPIEDDPYVHATGVASNDGNPFYAFIRDERIWFGPADSVAEAGDPLTCPRTSVAHPTVDGLLVSCTGTRTGEDVSGRVVYSDGTETKTIRSDGRCFTSAAATEGERWVAVFSDCDRGGAELVLGQANATWARTVVERPPSSLDIDVWRVEAVALDAQGRLHLVSVMSQVEDPPVDYAVFIEFVYSVHDTEGTMLDSVSVLEGIQGLSPATAAHGLLYPATIAATPEHAYVFLRNAGATDETILTAYHLVTD